MNVVARLFQSFSPRFFAYLCQIKKNQGEIPPFLFHGPLYSGKEWTVIKSMQFLSCEQFLEDDHHPLFCKTCFRISSLQVQEGVLPFFSALPLEQIQPVLLRNLGTLNEKTDPLQREALIHEIAKLEIFLESQLLKEREGGASKKLGVTKAQDFGTQLAQLRHDIVQGHVDSKQRKMLESLLSETAIFQTDMGLGFLRHLIKKLQLSSLHASSYRILLIKDPALLKYQEMIMNTLLKTVEDPHTRFATFFVTHNKNRVLRTIRSRSNTLAFAPFSSEYKTLLQTEIPAYQPLFSPQVELLAPSLADIKIAPPDLQKSLILEYLEYREAFYIGISPLLKQKRLAIRNLIIGLKEYNISVKNILDILPTL